MKFDIIIMNLKKIDKYEPYNNIIIMDLLKAYKSKIIKLKLKFKIKEYN